MDLLNKEKIQKLGATRVEEVDVEKISFDPELRKYCEMNHCGAFEKNWTCPPHIGEINFLISEIKEYKTAVVFQSVYQLEDSFDVEGMELANKEFRKLTNKIAHIFSASNPPTKMLSAGGCRICEKCGATTNTPCCFPSIAYSSLEAHGIQVSDLAKACNMNYINGQNTVTYFGAVFFKEQ